MRWVKEGLIYNTKGEYKWNLLYSQVPVAFPVREDKIRVLFGSRNAEGKSQIGFVDLCSTNLKKITRLSSEPILNYGQLGTFDEAGVIPSSIIMTNSVLYLYFVGYTVRKTIPYHNSIGLAISYDQGNSFERYSIGPILDSTVLEPYFSASCSVIQDKNLFKMWYLSCTKWELIKGIPEPFYNIKYAESENGINWNRKGIVCIENSINSEAIARPFVLKEGSIYKMWYSFRKAIDYRIDKSASYKLGYAESLDGLVWTRKDNLVGIDRSADGWDSEMIEYCYIIDINGKKYMFYNGNGFGKTGFGYAVMEE